MLIKLEKEQKWLPKLAPFLPLQIPTFIMNGSADKIYPHNWSLLSWIEGDSAAKINVSTSNQVAIDLAIIPYYQSSHCELTEVAKKILKEPQ